MTDGAIWQFVSLKEPNCWPPERANKARLAAIPGWLWRRGAEAPMQPSGWPPTDNEG